MTHYRLDRSYYSRQSEIIDSCEENFGLTRYGVLYDPEGAVVPGGARWSWSCTFGYTEIYFEESEDAVLFALKWL
jgi:hypothetical protein